MVEGEVLAVARAYVARLRESGLPVAGAVLHGACVACPPGEFDAIELLVLSERFGRDRVAEGRELVRAAWEVDPRIVPTPVHPAKWAEPDDDPALWEARRTGKEITNDE